MKIIDRLKLELSNQPYFTDIEYSQFLIENDLFSENEYEKKSMYKQLLLTVRDILEAVANDIDLMRSISTEFANIGEAYQYIELRIQQVENKINAIPDEEEEVSAFSLMYTRNGKKSYKRAGSSGSDYANMESIPNDVIDDWFE